MVLFGRVAWRRRERRERQRRGRCRRGRSCAGGGGGLDLGRRRRSASSGGLDLGLLLRRRRFLQNRAPAAARRGRRGRRAGPADGPDGLSGLPDPGGEPQRAAAKGRHRLFAVGDDKLETANSCVWRREDDLDVGDEARSDLDVDDVVASLADLVDCWFVIRGGRVESKRVSAGRGRESLSSSPSNSKRSKLNTQKTQNSKTKIPTKLKNHSLSVYLRRPVAQPDDRSRGPHEALDFSREGRAGDGVDGALIVGGF